MNNHNYMKRLRDLREDHDLTQKEIAYYLGTSQTMYARYEREANELPIRHFIALCKYYNPLYLDLPPQKEKYVDTCKLAKSNGSYQSDICLLSNNLILHLL